MGHKWCMGHLYGLFARGELGAFSAVGTGPFEAVGFQLGSVTMGHSCPGTGREQQQRLQSRAKASR